MIVFFSIASLLVFTIAFLIVLNFWKYRYKGDRTPQFVLIMFIVLICNYLLTVSYLVGNNFFSTSAPEENWDNF